jgi:hypothetical protein
MHRLVRTLPLLLAMLAPRTFADTPSVLPEGANREVVVRVCAMCHPIELVVAKPRSIDDWDMTIARMVDRGATITDAEQLQILAYLAKHFGASAAATPP